MPWRKFVLHTCFWHLRISRGKFACAVLVSVLSLQSFFYNLVCLTSYRVDIPRVYVEFMGFSFMTEPAVLGGCIRKPSSVLTRLNALSELKRA